MRGDFQFLKHLGHFYTSSTSVDQMIIIQFSRDIYLEMHGILSSNYYDKIILLRGPAKKNEFFGNVISLCYIRLKVKHMLDFYLTMVPKISHYCFKMTSCRYFSIKKLRSWVLQWNENQASFAFYPKKPKPKKI